MNILQTVVYLHLTLIGYLDALPFDEKFAQSVRGRRLKNLPERPEVVANYVKEYLSNSFEEDETLYPDEPRIESESDFVSYCTDWFLSPIPSFVTQSDFSLFLGTVCEILDDEDLPYFDCPEPDFHALDTRVQLLFINNLCGIGDRSDCMEAKTSSNDDEITFDVRQTSKKVLTKNFEEWCCGLLVFMKRAKLQNMEDAGKCENYELELMPPLVPDQQSPVPNGSTTTPTNQNFSVAPSVLPSPTAPPISYPTNPSQLPLPKPASSFAPAAPPITSSTLNQSNAPTLTSKGNDFNEMPNPEAEVAGTGPIDFNSNGGNVVSAGAIAGIAVGAGCLFVMFLVSSRRFFRRQDEEGADS